MVPDRSPPSYSGAFLCNHYERIHLAATVYAAANSSTYAVTLYAAYGTGTRCVNPGQAATYPGGFSIEAVQVGPGMECSW